MTNWKERVEAELSRQRAVEMARPEQERLASETEKQIRAQRERQREQELMDRLVQFDALGIPQKLTDINRDILKGLGKLSTFRRGTSSEGLTTAGLSLSIVIPEIVEKTVPIEERVFGTYFITLSGDAAGENGGPSTPVIVKELGWHTVIVGHKIGGYSERSAIEHNLRIGYRHGSKYAQIGVTDLLIIIDPGVKLRDGWRIIRGDLRHEVTYALYGDRRPNDIFPDSNEPYAKGIVLTFPVADFDNGSVSNFIDDILIQSCAARLPRVDGWIRKRAEADAKIRDIQSRVGQVRPR